MPQRMTKHRSPRRRRFSSMEGNRSCDGRSVPVDVLRCVLQFVMAETITFRPDDDALRALAVLTKDGTTVSNALRAALIDAARLRAQEKLRSESAALAANEQDRAEAAQVLRDMGTLRAW
jgi:hypothetical protein